MVRQAPVICVMVPPIHLGAWSMALMLWLPFELLLLLLFVPILVCEIIIIIISTLGDVRDDFFPVWRSIYSYQCDLVHKNNMCPGQCDTEQSQE